MKSLKNEKIWLVWKSEEVRGGQKTKNKRYTKVPYQINGKHASSTDPNTWVTFEEAQASVASFSGIGFSISKHTPLLCIDLDHCLDKDGNLTRDDFAIALEASDTYTEVSPSGDGLHIILALDDHFSLVANKKVHEDGTACEAYTENRYFTYTGKPYKEELPVRKVSKEVADEILQILGYPWGKKKKEVSKIDARTISLDLTDQVVVDKMFKSKGGNAIEKIYNGDASRHNGDISSADASLCAHLAFWTQKNAQQMERIWMSSPLGQREKTQKREDYRQRTIENAIEVTSEVYSPAPLVQEDATVQPELEKQITYITNNKGMPFVSAYNVTQILDADSTLNKAFRYNEFSHEHETNVRTGREFTPLQKDDIIFTMIYIQKTYSFFERVSQQVVQEAITSQAHKITVNPPVDMVKSATWDEVPRIEYWLSEVFGVEDNEVHRAIASNWLKGLVNRVVDPGCKFDTVLVLEGDQGIGKSSALRILGDPWYAETSMDIDTKDFQLILTNNIIVEFSEGASLSRSASAAMKQKITDQEDNFRKPYERTTQKYKRHCVFAMTTNEEQYLKDHTGNRRWLPVPLPKEKANLEWLKENKMQLYAEAYHKVYEKGETTWEFPEEIKEIQASRLEEDPWIGKISEWYFDKLTDEEREEGVTAVQAYEDGIHDGYTTRDLRSGESHRISSIMTNHMALEKRRSMINAIRAYRYFPTHITAKLNKERYEDLTPSERKKKAEMASWTSFDTPKEKDPEKVEDDLIDEAVKKF